MHPVTYYSPEDQLNESLTCCCFFCYPDAERLVFQTRNFYALLGLGPIAEGYTILASKEHYRCCHEIPKELWEEMLACISFLRDLLGETYGVPIIYEHGRAGGCFVREGDFKHCFHAHLNLLPCTILPDFQPQDNAERHVVWTRVESLQAFLSSGESNPYLLLNSAAHGWFAAWLSDPRQLQPQYLRRVIASHMQVGNAWNWFENPNAPAVARAKATFTEKTKSPVCPPSNLLDLEFKWGI